jgi:nucleoside-diphosphate-sugar epimerase
VIVGDVRDRARLKSALAGCEAVFHLAAAHHDTGIPKATYFDVNVAGTRLLCELMSELGIAALCFTSSVAVFGERDGAAEEFGREGKSPNSPYGESKLDAEDVCVEWQRGSADRRLIVVRPAVVFGPGHFANVYALIRQIHSGFYASLGPGTNVKSLAYVENLVGAMLHAFDSVPHGERLAFNYCDKPDLSSRELENVLYRLLGKRRLLPSLPLSAGLALALPVEAVGGALGVSVPITRARIRKFALAHTAFAAQVIRRHGFSPRVPLHQGLERMVQWYLETGRSLPREIRLPPAVNGRALS